MEIVIYLSAAAAFIETYYAVNKKVSSKFDVTVICS